MPQPKKPTKQIARSHRYTVYYQRATEVEGYTAHVPALGIVTEAAPLLVAT